MSLANLGMGLVGEDEPAAVMAEATGRLASFKETGPAVLSHNMQMINAGAFHGGSLPKNGSGLSQGV